MIKTFMYDKEEYTVVEVYTNDRPKESFRVWVPAEQNELNIVTALPC